MYNKYHNNFYNKYICIIFVGKMFIRRIHKNQNGKRYTTTYIAESYRDEDGKVKHKHLSNISKWSESMIRSFEQILKGQKTTSISDLAFSQGKSMGAIYVISAVAKRLGISQALGYSKQAKLALFQVAGRIITQGSRYYLANEWKQHQEVDKVFKISNFNHNDLYDNLAWLAENQAKIEERIYKFRHKKSPAKQIFLYDVTSSYLEGNHNELADYGYNRDKKKGKKQIVIGLMTDQDGYPVAVEVFKGNTADSHTVSGQLEKLKNKFGVEQVVLVGDKGMIKSTQVEAITSEEYRWDYLTSITKEQIGTLLKQNVLQLELFDDELIEVEDDGVRYLLRKNPIRQNEIRQNRDEKIQKIRALAEGLTHYLNEHKKASEEVALRRINEKISAFKLSKFASCALSGRNITVEIDEGSLKETAKLDGCYVIKTNVSKDCLDKETAHNRYKDLAQVEYAFRTLKTTLEHIRPIYVRTEESTRGHVLVASLAYLIIKYITDATNELGYTRKFIFETLDKINYLEYTYENEKIVILPKNLLEAQSKILGKLNITLS